MERGSYRMETRRLLDEKDARIAELEADNSEFQVSLFNSRELADNLLGSCNRYTDIIADLRRDLEKTRLGVIAAQPTCGAVCEAVETAILCTGEQYDDWDSGKECGKIEAVRAIRDAFAAAKEQTP